METETAGKHVVIYSLLINTGIRHICHTVIDECPAALKKWSVTIWKQRTNTEHEKKKDKIEVPTDLHLTSSNINRDVTIPASYFNWAAITSLFIQHLSVLQPLRTHAIERWYGAKRKVKYRLLIGSANWLLPCSVCFIFFLWKQIS